MKIVGAASTDLHLKGKLQVSDERKLELVSSISTGLDKRNFSA